MNTAQRLQAARRLARKMFKEDGGTAVIDHNDIVDAVGALDDFLESNVIVINNVIPEPAKSELTTAQKAVLLAYVVMKRGGLI